MNKAVFLDRDGTINKDFGYVYKKEQLEFVPGVLDALRKIQRAGFKILIITNQSGIGRGYFTIEQYQKFETFMLEQMADNVQSSTANIKFFKNMLRKRARRCIRDLKRYLSNKEITLNMLGRADI